MQRFRSQFDNLTAPNYRFDLLAFRTRLIDNYGTNGTELIRWGGKSWTE